MQEESPTACVMLNLELPRLTREEKQLSWPEVSWDQWPHVAFLLPKSFTGFQKTTQGPYEFVCNLRDQKRAWVR